MSTAMGTRAISPSESEAVHRSFRVNRIVPHPKRKILIIHGELNVSIIGAGAISLHDSLAEDTRDFKKLIRLDSASPSIDPSEIIEEILIECPYIIEQETLDLLTSSVKVVLSRKYDVNGVVVTDKHNNHQQRKGKYYTSSEDDEYDNEDDENLGTSSSFPNIFDDEDLLTTLDHEADLKEITIDNLENYIELLYEDLQEKAKGAYCISRLVTMSEHMIIIFNHESAMNALFRTLREDYKKSIHLTTNILRVFLQFAEFIDFHQHLLGQKLSSLIFEIIEYELDVYVQWKAEVESRRQALNSILSLEQSHLQKPVESAGGDNNLSGMSTKALKAQVQFDRIQLRFDELTNKQNILLYVALKTTKYLRQSIPIEELCKKDIVKLVLSCIERKHYELRATALQFLSILAVYLECKLQMIKFGIIDVSPQFLNPNEFPMTIVQSTVVLLYNLSFDTKSRQKMVKHGVLTKVAYLFETGNLPLQQKCILLLYNFSMDRKNRPRFALTNVVQRILSEIETRKEESPTNIYMIALMLNLSTSKRCSQIIFRGNGLSLLIQWAFRQENHLIMKIVRKLAEHDLGGPVKSEFVQYISDIAGAVSKTSNIEFTIECIGTLGNLNIDDLDFKRLLQQCGLLPWIKAMLNKTLPVRSSKTKLGEQRKIDETLFIEIAIFLSTCVEDIECSKFILQDELTLKLLALLDNSIRIDQEIQIQVIYVIYKMCRHKPLLQLILEKSKIPETMIKLLQSDIEPLRELAEAVLDLLSEFNSDWNSRAKQEKFTAYNQHWLEMVSRPEGQMEDVPKKQHQQQKRPSSAMRRPPSATSVGESSGRLVQSSSARSLMSASRTSKESETTTTTSDDSEGEDVEEIIDVEDDDEQFSKQRQQQHLKPSSNAVLNDSIESRNIFERFQHQFQQERVAQERNEYYGILNSDPEYNYDEENGDDDVDSQRNGGGGSSSGSDILVQFGRKRTNRT